MPPNLILSRCSALRLLRPPCPACPWRSPARPCSSGTCAAPRSASCPAASSASPPPALARQVLRLDEPRRCASSRTCSARNVLLAGRPVVGHRHRAHVVDPQVRRLQLRASSFSSPRCQITSATAAAARTSRRRVALAVRGHDLRIRVGQRPPVLAPAAAPLPVASYGQPRYRHSHVLCRCFRASQRGFFFLDVSFTLPSPSDLSPSTISASTSLPASLSERIAASRNAVLANTRDLTS